MEELMRKEYERKAIEEFGINNINFEGLNKETIDEIIQGMENVYNKYPLIFSKIDAIGNEKYVKDTLWNLGYDVTDAFKNSDAFEENKMMCITKRKKILSIFNTNDYHFITIVFGRHINDLIKENEENYTGIYTIKSGIIHEFGHILDHLLNLSKDSSLKKVILGDDIDNKVLDGFFSEMIAITFQMHMSGIESEKVNAVISKINEKYAEFEIKENRKHK